MMIRAPGFYWVRTRDTDGIANDGWTIGEWDDRNWSVVGCDLFLDDSNIADVGERVTRE